MAVQILLSIAVILLIFSWIVSGLTAYGATLAHFQRKFPLVAKQDARSDVRMAVFMGMLGPIGLATALFHGGFSYGIMWRVSS